MSQYPRYLYGIHDPGGEHLMQDAPGTVVYTVDVRSDPPIDFTHQSAAGLRAIVRLNWSHHGAGTIPPSQELWPDFARLCADYAAGCVAVRDFIVANEPNHEQEWGKAPPIQPATYAACYKQVYAAMKQARPQAQIAPAAIAPWTDAVGMGWIEYFQQMLRTIGPSHIDFLALHAYSRGYDPASVQSTAKMDPPYQRYYSGFRTYLDFLAAVPREFTALPVDITETNGDEAWPDRNTGWVQAAYAEISRHNHAKSSQKIRSLCLFRWQHFEGQPWGFEHKPGVHEDFRAAVAERYPAPSDAPFNPDNTGASTPPQLPTPPATGHPVTPATSQPAVWDPRLDALGVEHKPQTPAPGVTAYRLIEARWFDVAEAQGRRNVFVDVLDEGGARLPVPVHFWWGDGGPDESDTKGIDLNKRDPWADYGIDFPLSSAGRAYGVAVADNGKPSDAVLGMGLGTVEERHTPHHTAYKLVFQRVTAPAAQNPAPPAVPRPEPAPPTWESETNPLQPNPDPEAEPLTWPVQGWISQRWGERPELYQRQFGIPYHNGTDIAAPTGTDIRAIAAGEVMFAGQDAGYGNYVRIYHPAHRFHSFYAHNRDNLVQAGQRVEQGQVIARIGSTGNSTGPHLHLEIRLGSRDAYSQGTFGHTRGRVDPETVFAVLAACGAQAGAQVRPHSRIAVILMDAAREFDVDPFLLLSLAWAESSFNPQAKSAAGAQGLTQIMPETWREWAHKVGASDPFDPRDNARVGAVYWQWILYQIGEERRALWAYVWGIGNVLKSGRPGNAPRPPAEVLEYANKILHGRDLLKAMG